MFVWAAIAGAVRVRGHRQQRQRGRGHCGNVTGKQRFRALGVGLGNPKRHINFAGKLRLLDFAQQKEGVCGGDWGV